MFYEVMLNLRTNIGIDKEVFKDKYKINIDDIFNYKELVNSNILEEDNRYLRVYEDYFYVLDEIILKF